MPPLAYTNGPWELECLPNDGARVSRISWNSLNLLTARPERFVPQPRFGAFETRPVYGCDDCFPTVDECPFPEREEIAAPDHGELCYLPWRVAIRGNRLECAVASRLLPVEFRRTLVFNANSLEWHFAVENLSDQGLPFLHVMHALMPPTQISEIYLPEYESLYDEARAETVEHEFPSSLAAKLLATPAGVARMLLLRGVGEGCVRLALPRVKLEITFPRDLFPTLGIWWNNAGYPSSGGHERCECAFEPIPGSSSSLFKSWRDGSTLVVAGRSKLSWSILWRVSSP